MKCIVVFCSRNLAIFTLLDARPVSSVAYFCSVSHLHHHHHGVADDVKCDVICVVCTAENSDKFERMPDRELEKLVDGILDDNDGNLDGFIDYPEFLLSQR